MGVGVSTPVSRPSLLVLSRALSLSLPIYPIDSEMTALTLGNLLILN